MDAAVGRHRAMLIVVGMLAVGVVVGAGLLWPRGEVNRPAAAGQPDPTRLVSATLTRVQPLECEEADPGIPSSICIRVEARLADGKQVRFDTTDLTGTTFRAGQQVTLSVQEQEGQPPSITSATWSAPDQCSPWWPCSRWPWWPSVAGKGSVR
jgi:hypothetical protein